MKMLDAKATGRNLEKLIHESGMKPQQLCIKIGLTGAVSYYKWRSGKSLPSIDNLVLISSVLGCSIDDIIRVKDCEVS